MISPAPDYLHPDVPAGLGGFAIPLVHATEETLRGYGTLVSDPALHSIEIVRWPAAGWRPVDQDSGDQGGTTEGVFSCWWDEDRFYGRNDAVSGHYILGFAHPPGTGGGQETSDSTLARRDRVFLWHANYHPDGGQLFYPLARQAFVVPLALPGDDVRPESFVAFAFDGSAGLYIHPNVWHDGVYCASPSARFLDRQGKVHARVSVDFGREFGVLLEVPLQDGTRDTPASVRSR